MPPETGNSADDSKKLPVSGGIKIYILMSPETGNWLRNFKKLPVSGGMKSDILLPPETGNFFKSPAQLPWEPSCFTVLFGVTEML